MTGPPWQAPRTAYLLTAATAEGNETAGDALWDRLDDAGQADVLAALGAQLRNILRTAAQKNSDQLDGEIDLSRLYGEVCIEAIAGLTALIEQGPWQPPPCPHCRYKVAGALAGMITAVSVRYLGMSPEGIAHSCRQTAARTART